MGSIPWSEASEPWRFTVHLSQPILPKLRQRRSGSSIPGGAALRARGDPDGLRLSEPAGLKACAMGSGRTKRLRGWLHLWSQKSCTSIARLHDSGDLSCVAEVILRVTLTRWRHVVVSCLHRDILLFGMDTKLFAPWQE